MFKDKLAREAIKELCRSFGFSYKEYEQKLSINEFNFTDGANMNRWPVENEVFDSVITKIRNRIYSLEEYLGIEYTDIGTKHIKKSKKK